MKVNHLIAQFVDRLAPAPPDGRTLGATPRRRRADAGARTSRRPSASGTPSATSRSRPSCARATRTCRSTGSPSTRSPGCSRSTASGCTPRPRGCATSPAHIEHEAGEHDLHAFQAIRRMDEILVHNFMVFDEVVADGDYDLVIGDEAWDVDYFLHENPELKRFAFAWMTDFVGWLPMPDGGAARGRADRRLQRGDDRAARPVRARAGPVGVRRRPGRRRRRTTSAPACRASATWTEENFDFAGYVTGFDPAALRGRERAAGALGVATGREALPGHRRRLRRRDVAAAPGAWTPCPLVRRLAPGAAVRVRHRPADRPGVAARRTRGRRCSATCRTCSGTWRRATSPWCRAG